MLRLTRYIVGELLTPFLFGIFLFLSVFIVGNVLSRLTQLLAETNMTVGQASRFFWLSLPHYLTYSFPMAFLAAVLWAFGRLSSEQELTAMRAGGFSIRRAALPAVALAAVVSVFAVAFNEFVASPTTLAVREMMAEVRGQAGPVAQHLLLPRLTESGRLSWIVYLEQVYPAEDRFRGFYAVSPGEREQVTVRAQSGVWDADEWVLEDGEVERTPRGTGNPVVVPFERLAAQAVGIALESPEALVLRGQHPDTMSFRQLRTLIRSMAPSERDLGYLQWELQNKLAVPFATLVFALAAVPLGMRPARGGSWLKVGFAIPIIVAYYMLWHLLGIAAGRSLLPAVPAAWAPNVVLGLVGVVVLLRSR